MTGEAAARTGHAGVWQTASMFLPRKTAADGAALGLSRLPQLESLRYWVWVCPEALRDLFLALGVAVAGDGKTRTERLVGPGRLTWSPP